MAEKHAESTESSKSQDTAIDPQPDSVSELCEAVRSALGPGLMGIIEITEDSRVFLSYESKVVATAAWRALARKGLRWDLETDEVTRDDSVTEQERAYTIIQIGHSKGRHTKVPVGPLRDRGVTE